jgi:hypothetical protein
LHFLTAAAAAAFFKEDLQGRKFSLIMRINVFLNVHRRRVQLNVLMMSALF